MAHWLKNGLVLAYPSAGVTLRLEGTLDWRVLAASFSVCLVSTLLVGLVPALQAGKIDLSSALKSESGGVVAGSVTPRLRSSSSRWR